MIDVQARRKLQDYQNNKYLVKGVKDSIVSAIRDSSNPNEEVLKLVVKQEGNIEQTELLQKLGNALAMIYKRIPPPVSFPKIFQVAGKVKAEITNKPVVEVSNFKEVIQHLKALEVRLSAMATAISMIAIQKPLEYPEIKIPVFNVDPLIEAIHEIDGGSVNNEDVVNATNRVYDAIAALANRPSMTTAPATHFSINSLSGVVLTTQIQLGSSITPLPAIPLKQRRAIQLYNNGSNTIYIGGSNITTANGIPVPSGAYSTIFDMGQNMSLYGISASGQNNDIRVLEISDQDSGR